MPDAGIGNLPMQETLFVAQHLRFGQQVSEGIERRPTGRGVPEYIRLIRFRFTNQRRLLRFIGSPQFDRARGNLNGIAILAVQIRHNTGPLVRLARVQPPQRVVKVQKSSQGSGRFGHSLEVRTGLPNLGDIRVRYLFHPRHTRRGGACLGHVPVDEQAVPALAQFVLQWPNPLSVKGIAATQMVVEERKWCAHGEGVKPQGKFGEFHGHRILIDAIDHPLEDDSADDLTVVELSFVDNPAMFVGLFQNSFPDAGKACGQRRFEGMIFVRPGYALCRLRHGFKNAVRKVIDERNKEMPASHRGIANFDLQVGRRGIAGF